MTGKLHGTITIPARHVIPESKTGSERYQAVPTALGLSSGRRAVIINHGFRLGKAE